MTAHSDYLKKLAIKFTDLVCRNGFGNRMNETTLLHLDDIRLFRPTADGSTLLQLEDIFDSWQTEELPEALSAILNGIIQKREYRAPDFDFRRIESLTASTGFGRGCTPSVNGSWFRNLCDWGKGMYPGENLKSETLEDWENNVRHIEHGEFSRAVPVRVTYYGWYDRYVASNNNDAHHTAKVIYQACRDNISYQRDAVIEELFINSAGVQALESRFCSFLFLTKNNNADGMQSDGDTWFRQSLTDLVSDDVYLLYPQHYRENIKFAFIPRKRLKVHESSLQRWMDLASAAGKIIPLPAYLNNPAAFHTRPYIHEVDHITLGSPFRR